MFLISLPSILLLTASSTILPLFVRGMSLTTIILVGTCLGDAFFFIEMQSLNNKLNLNQLSMGMSADYLKAAEYSSTFLRIGSSIFGKRI